MRILKVVLTKNNTGSRVLIVEYNNDDFNATIDDALRTCGLQRGQVSVIALPARSKLKFRPSKKGHRK